MNRQLLNTGIAIVIVSLIFTIFQVTRYGWSSTTKFQPVYTFIEIALMLIMFRFIDFALNWHIGGKNEG